MGLRPFWGERSKSPNEKKSDKYADPFKEGTYTTQDYDGKTSHLPYKGKTWGNGIDKGSGGKIWEIIWTGPKGNIKYQSKDYVYNGKKTPYGNNGRVTFTVNEVKYRAVFAHLDDKTDMTNREINTGDTIGYMGWTGNCIPANKNGLHTHMEVHVFNGKSWINEDPKKYFYLK